MLFNVHFAVSFHGTFAGEHIDYCGYSVLPMAVQQDILVAVQRTTDDVSL